MSETSSGYEPWWAKWGIMGVLLLGVLWRVDYHVETVIAEMSLHYEQMHGDLVNHLTVNNVIKQRLNDNLVKQILYLDRITEALESE